MQGIECLTIEKGPDADIWLAKKRTQYLVRQEVKVQSEALNPDCKRYSSPRG